MNLKTIALVIVLFTAASSSAMTVAERDTITTHDSHTPTASGGTQDAVYLKNGSIIRGTILEFIQDSTVRIQTRDGSVFVYPASDVQKIVKEQAPSSAGTALPVERKTGLRSRIQIGPMVGYGTTDGYNFGFGLRLGGTLASGSYFGGIFVYHLGKSQDYSFGYGYGASAQFHITYNALYIGPEVGHDIQASENFIIRPYFGFGYFDAMASLEGSGSSATTSEARFYASPGLMLNILAGKQALIGLDGRYVIVTGEQGSNANSFGIFLWLGIIP